MLFIRYYGLWVDIPIFVFICAEAPVPDSCYSGGLKPMIMMSDLDVYQDQKEININSLASFSTWKRSVYRIRLQSNPVKYSFDLPAFSADENRKISNHINDYHDECGCKTGSVFMMSALILTVAGYFISGGKFSALSFSKVFWFVGIVLLAALSGKVIGLLHARWKLIKLSENLQKSLDDSYGKKLKNNV